MYKLGEYSVASKFPYLQSTFSIEFYGANGKGDLLLDIFKEDGTIIASVTLKDVKSGPYYFSTTSAIMAGFSIHNSEIGGLALYEIGFMKPNVAPGFLDTYTGPNDETLDVHISDSGHIYYRIYPLDWSGDVYLSFNNYSLDGNGNMKATVVDGLAYLSANWKPQTKSWYVEVTFNKQLVGWNEDFRVGLKTLDGQWLGPEIQFYSVGYEISTNDGDFLGWYSNNTLGNGIIKVRIEIIEHKKVLFYVNETLVYDSFADVAVDLNFAFSIAHFFVAFEDVTVGHITVDKIEANDLTPIDAQPVRFVAVSNGDGYPSMLRVMYSKTGDIWLFPFYYDDVNESEGADWQSIAYGNGIFLAVASNPMPAHNTEYAMTSSDGENWTLQANTPANYYFYQIKFCKDIFIGCMNEEYDQGYNTIAKTSDGETWSTQTISGGPWFAAAYGNNTFVLVGNGTAGSRAAYSTDASSWTVTSSLASNDGNWHRVNWCKDRFIALSYSQGYTDKQMMSSTDGITWTAVTLPTEAETVQWQDVIYANNIFVAVGRDLWDNYSNSSFKSAVMTSTDGSNWTIRTTPTYGSWKSIAYGNGKFYVVADASDGVWSYYNVTASTLLMSSEDGINWNIEYPSAASPWTAIVSTG